MTVVLDHDGRRRSSPAPTSPTSRGTGSRRSGRCWRRWSTPGASAATRCARSPATSARAPAPAAAAGRRRRSAAESLAAAVDAPSRGEFDAERGGFGGAPKFPPSMVLEFLLAARRPAGDRARADGRRDPATAMARGGIYDQLAGGFARYCVDAGWVVPHFEKMLYDNAQLLARLRPLVAPPARARRRVAEETADFLLGELRTAEGGFASALDADTEGAEGTFYVWTPAAARRGARPRRRRLGGGAARRSPRRAPSSTARRRCSCATDPDDLERWSDCAAPAARGPRPARARPARDDKVVAAWNGLAITGAVPRPGRCSGCRSTSRRPSPPASCWSDVHLDRRPAAAGLARRRGRPPRRRAGGLRLRRAAASSTCCRHRRPGLARAGRAPARRALDGSRPGRRLPRHRRRRRGARRAGRATPPTTPARPAVGDGARPARRTPP